MRVAVVVGSVLSFLSLLCAACGRDASASIDAHAARTRARAIVGGALATPADIGATVSVRTWYSQSTFGSCTGTLIAPRVVVSAAHCYDEGGSSEVAGGILDTDSPSAQWVSVQSLVMHPWFPLTVHTTELEDNGDIAVLVLASALPGVTPAPILPMTSVDAALQPGDPVSIVGFGDDGSGQGAGTLRKATISYQTRGASELRAGAPGEPSSCFGDSGGPLYKDSGGQRYLVGVVSRGATTSICANGAIYSLAPAFTAWLEDESGGLFSADGTPPVDTPPDDPPADDPPVDDPPPDLPPGEVEDMFEENDTASQATAIGCGDSLWGFVATQDDDWFAVDVDAGAFSVAVDGQTDADLDLIIQLEDAELARSESSTGEEHASGATQAGRLFVHVLGWNGAQGSYALSVDCNAASPPPPDEPEDDEPEDDEPNDEPNDDEPPPPVDGRDDDEPVSDPAPPDAPALDDGGAFTLRERDRGGCTTSGAHVPLACALFAVLRGARRPATTRRR